MPKPPPDPKPGSRWRHYKGEVLKVVAVGFLSWSRSVPVVIVENADGVTLVYLIEEWRGKAESPDGRRCPRFTEIKPDA